MRILFVGDVFGKPGRKAVERYLAVIRKDELIDFTIVNCENAAGGFGLTERLMNDLLSLDIDVLTSGNHIWDKKDFVPVLNKEPRILRPANYPQAAPGRGYAVFEKRGRKILVVNLQGRAFMPPIDCPFARLAAILEEADATSVFIDMHAEATAEKIALARYFDGRISVLAGTHTHVQTADETILPGGTAFITDVGMTGSHGGVIGMKLASVLPKFLLGLPSKFEVDDTESRFQAIVVDIDDETGRAVDIKRINVLLD